MTPADLAPYLPIIAGLVVVLLVDCSSAARYTAARIAEGIGQRGRAP